MLGLTDPSPWADSGKAHGITETLTRNTCYTRLNLGKILKEIGILVQEEFWKIHALMKDPFYKEKFCPSRLGLFKRISIRKRLLH